MFGFLMKGKPEVDEEHPLTGLKNLVADNLSINVMLVDRAYDIVYLNPAVKAFFREHEDAVKCGIPSFDAETLLGRNMDEFHVNPGKQRKIMEVLEGAHRAEIIVGRAHFSLVATPLLDTSGARLGTMVVWTDSRKEREYQAQVSAITRSQAVIHFDMDGTILYANDLFLRVMDYRLDEIVGKHHKMFCDADYVRSKEYERFWAKLKQGEFQAERFYRVGKNGKAVWLEASYNPIMDAAGVPYMVIKYATDLTPRKEETLALADGFERNVKSLVETVAQSAERVKGTADSVSTSTEQTRSQSEQVDQTTFELSKAINEISNQVTNAVDVVARTSHQVQTSKTLVGNVVQAAERINEVTNLISVIANQTNLLALNATIEAASAGDAGKGFAVVAGEVKALARETASATKEIEKQIRDMQQASRKTAEAIDKIPMMMEEISDISRAISSAVEEQSAATDETSHNINGVLTVAKETGSHATSLLAVATDLSRQCVQLQDRVGAFLQGVREM